MIDRESASIRLTCCSSTARRAQLARDGELQQLVVGNRIPQEERQVRGELEIADRVGRTGPHTGRDTLGAIQEERARQESRDRAPHAAFEAAVLHAVVVVGEQLVDVLRGDWPAIRVSCQGRDDLLRAGSLRVRCCTRGGLAAEDARTARRLAQALGVERPLQLERLHAIEAILTAALREHLQLVVGLGEGAALERDTDLVRPGRREELDVLQPRVDPIERTVLHLIVKLHVLFAADHRLVDQLVVERDDERVLELHAVAPDMGGHVGDVDRVFAVGGQIDGGENAAARAERKTGNMRELRTRLGAERPAAGTRIGLAERLHRDGARRDHVLLDERRRHLQARRNVVEPFHHIVSRQHSGRVEIHREEIANGVRVFLAIEPMQDDFVRHVRLTGRLVERGLEERDQPVGRRGIRLPRSRRRHHASAHLAHRLLEHVGVLGDALRA